MTVSYQRPAAPGDWGTILVKDRAVPVRLAVLIGGVAIWLGLMLIATGADGLVALWTNLLFLAGLLLITLGTRSVGLGTVIWLTLMGGLMMAVMLPVSGLFSAIVPDPNAASRAFVIPFAEEALKLIPVLYLLWQWRGGRAWGLGAGDLLVMGAAAGAGFGLVEDAYIRHRFGWPSEVGWLPVTEIIGSHLIVGHAVWTAIAAGVLGLGLLLFRSRGRLALLVGGAGFGWAVLDHVANNYANRASGVLADVLIMATADGWASLWLFVGIVAAAVIVDALVVNRTLPRLPELEAPPLGSSPAQAIAAWQVRRRNRALAYAVFQYRRAVADSGTEPPGMWTEMVPLLSFLAEGRIDADRAAEETGS